MKNSILRINLSVILLVITVVSFSQETGWRGPGYSSATATNDAVFITGIRGNKDVLTAFTQDGKKKWDVEYGNISQAQNHPESRCTPTFANGKIFVVSGSGELTCVLPNGKILWTVDYYTKYKSTVPRFGISESPLVVDNKVIVTPGGNIAAMVAFNVDNGNVVWETESLKEGSQYVNPLLIEKDGKKVIITLTPTWIIGVNAADGHDNNSMGRWICVDWTTGKTMWTTNWYNKGSIISADGLLYLYEERSGYVALAKTNSQKLEIVSEFQIEKGTGPFWAHPVIDKGRLFIRHGDYLAVYSLKQE